MATEKPVHVRASASILGHSSFQTTEEYYIQAQYAQAHETYIEQMHAIRIHAKSTKASTIKRQSGRSWRS
jgi:hypothetical protein